MNPEWQEKLTSFGVTREGDNFSYPAAADAENVFCTLASYSVLHVSGDDAESFLQGQFSNDIAALESPGSQLTTWSSPKGRVIVLIRVVKIDTGYLLMLPTELLEAVAKRLRMYVLRAKVVIEQRPDLIAVGISGDGAEALQNAGVALPASVDAATANEHAVSVVRVRGAVPRYELIATADQLADLWQQCSDTCELASEANWRLQNIDAGLPSVNAGTTEAFVLQMMNLQHIDGVSFKKGCFPGQEVVARMQYLGKLKRQMFRFETKGPVTPAPGDEIYKAGGGSAAGKVVDAVATESGIRLLAVVAIDATTQTLYLDKVSGQALQLLEMPYSTGQAEDS